ncbi:MAG: RNA-directed DNA polymerase [Planctomycetaceae bacterium]|nr:RNA-directed DNA polymerase [Planctomycetaceae bacterium]
MVFDKLAELLLDSDWTHEAIVRLLTACYRPPLSLRKTRPPKHELLATSILTAFPSPPSQARLIEHLRLSPGARRGFRYGKVQQVKLDAQMAGGQMRHTPTLQSGWDYPRISNLRELAECLGILDQTLNWLARGPRGNHACAAHYRIQAVEKRAGGCRLIEAPKATLKRTQREILRHVLNRLPVHVAAHGFVPQRSTLSHARLHVGQKWMLRMDLEDFFPSIDGSRVFGLFRSLGYPYEVVQALTNLTTHVLSIDAIRESVRHLARNARNERTITDLARLYFRRHLPQGAPTSPMLANLIAYRFDCRLTGLAKTCHVTYSRYGDDLLFSGSSTCHSSLSKIEDHVGAIAIEEGFRVRHRKTAFIPNSQRQAAVGIVLNEKPNVARHEYDQLKAILHNCVRYGPESQNRVGHDNFAAHLLGRIQWLRSLHPQRGEKLFECFKRIHFG